MIDDWLLCPISNIFLILSIPISIFTGSRLHLELLFLYQMILLSCFHQEWIYLKIFFPKLSIIFQLFFHQQPMQRLLQVKTKQNNKLIIIFERNNTLSCWNFWCFWREGSSSALIKLGEQIITVFLTAA